MNTTVFGEFFCLHKKFLVFNLVSRNLKTRYHRSMLGILWTLITPLSMALMYYFIFSFVFKVRTPHYLVYVLSGILPWTFFSQTLLDGMESLVGSASMVTKASIPIQVFSFSAALTAMVNLAASLPIIFAFAWANGLTPDLGWLWMIFFSLALLMLGYFISLILSVGFVFFRDLRHIMGIIMQIWIYSTPILYEPSMIPERFHWIIYANPVSPFFVAMRSFLIDRTYPSTEVSIAAAAWFFFFFATSLIFQRTCSRGLVEHL